MDFLRRAGHAYYLRTITAQTRSAFVARENRCPPRIKCGAGFLRIMR
jgi:hypothetical protein